MTDAAQQSASVTCPEDDPRLRTDTSASLVESYEFEARIGLSGVTGIKAKAQTHLWSPMSKAGTALFVSAGGCLCTVILHETGAPEWAQLVGMLLPWLIVLSLEFLGLRARRRRRPGHGFPKQAPRHCSAGRRRPCRLRDQAHELVTCVLPGASPVIDAVDGEAAAEQGRHLRY